LIYPDLKNRLQVFIALAGVCFLVFANSLTGDFIYDDFAILLNNPSIGHPGKFLLSPADFLYSLNFLLAKGSPFVYHLTNILLHAINTVLVFMFLKLFFKTEGSMLGALLFAVHPVHAEAVTWITARGYLTIAFFILVPYLLYYRATSAKNGSKKIRIIFYLLSLFIFAYFLVRSLSFYAFFPLLLILSDITFRKWRTTWKLWLPFLLVLAVQLFLARGLISSRIGTAAAEMGTKPIWHNPLLNLIYSVFIHSGLLLWPDNLTLYHDPIRVSAVRTFLGGAGLLAIVAISPFLFKKAKELFFAIWLFILFLAPTYSPVPIVSLIGERYLYFPSVALCMFTAYCYEKYRFASHEGKRKAVILLLFLVAAYGARTVSRNTDWKDQGRFWRVTAIASPGSAWAHSNLGFAFQREGNTQAAIIEYEKAIHLKPNLWDAYNNLGTVYHAIGRIQEAVTVYNKLLAGNPGFAKAYNNLGVIYNEIGKNDEAIVAYQKAVEIDPGYANGYFNLSVLYKLMGRQREAQAAYQKAIEINPALQSMPYRP